MDVARPKSPDSRAAPAKVDAPATDPRFIDRFDGGFGWIAHPDEAMQRASHALVADGAVWVVDPIDVPGLDDRLTERGAVAGVVALFNWHTRDASAVATRHGVAVHVPTWVTRVAGRVEAPVERFHGELGDSGYRAVRITPHPLWREAALYHEADGTLLVPDSVGTAAYFRAPGERLGVSAYQRPWPPRRALGVLQPERLLLGHGAGIFDGATPALAEALASARRRAPAAIATNLGTLPRTLAAALRD